MFCYFVLVRMHKLLTAKMAALAKLNYCVTLDIQTDWTLSIMR